MDTVYPEKLSLLHRRAIRRRMRHDNARYRTQPVTFTEIKEVDEDNIDESESVEVTQASQSRLENIDINKKFDEFKRLHHLRRRHKEEPPVTPTNSPTEDMNNPYRSLVDSNYKPSYDLGNKERNNNRMVTPRPSL